MRNHTDGHSGQDTSSLPRILLNSNSNSASNSPLNTSIHSPIRIATPPSTAFQKKYKDDRALIYKHIKVESAGDSLDSDWKRSVSFDTIAGTKHAPNDGHASVRRGRSSSRPHYSTDDDFEPSRFSDYEEPRAKSPAGHRLSSPSRCGVQLNEDGFRTDYPSRGPVVSADALTLNVSSGELSDRVGVTWLVYISGRRHSWVALDYIVSRMLNNGDKLVVMSRVPVSLTDCLFDLSDSKFQTQKEFDPELFRRTSDRIKNYVKKIADPSISFKLSVEIFLSRSTDDAIAKCIDIHDPHTIAVSFKPSLKFLSSVSWLKTSRISHRLIKNFPLPVIVVPVLTLNFFEVELFEELAEKKHWELNLSDLKARLYDMDEKKQMLPDAQLDKLLQKRLNELKGNRSRKTYRSQRSLSSSNTGNKPGDGNGNGNGNGDADKIDDDDNSDSDDVNSIVSGSSSNSNSDSEETDSGSDALISNDAYLILSEAVKKKRGELRAHFKAVSKIPLNPDWFLDNLTKVSDLTARVAHELDVASKDSAAADLVRSLTGMPDLQKQKSMLDVLDEASAIDKLKKQLTSSGSGTSTPVPSSVKFNLDPKAKKKNSSLSSSLHSSSNSLRKTMSNVTDQKRFMSPLSKESSNDLKPFVSHDVTTRRDELVRAQSESVVTTVAEKKKKKKGGLFSLFKGK